MLFSIFTFMSIFNSLGSNYNLGFALKALFTGGNKVQLVNFLEKKYQGKAVLTYKGREALRLALQTADLPENSLVAINVYTCFAVFDAVVKAGHKVLYLDIDPQTLNFTYDTFKKAADKNKAVKAVIVQNTLGYASGIEKIANYCKEKSIILIEDLAHCVGTEYEKQEAGTVGDFTALSFSQDKMIDGVSGGAVVIKNQRSKIKDQRYIDIPWKQQIKDRFYPSLTWKIRFTYASGYGKLLHWLFKKSNLLSSPMGHLGTDGIYELPDWYCGLINSQFNDLNNNLKHRKKIAGIYAKYLDKKILSADICTRINKSSNLRFPVFVEKREELIKYLKEYNIYVSDIWYDSPIAPKKYLHLTDYKNQCPESEKISSLMLNLPTHRNISEKDAEKISELINKWLEKNIKY